MRLRGGLSQERRGETLVFGAQFCDELKPPLLHHMALCPLAQLELKATASKGRDTRSILRRAHDARAPKESPITVQLYLNVRKEGGGGVAVGAMMRPVIASAPRHSWKV